MRRQVFAGLGVLLLAAAPSWAHHSFALYDRNKTEQLSGTVIWVEWANPHNYLRLKTSDGAVWLMEFGTPGVNLRMGWTPNTVQRGQKITITYAPKIGDPHEGSIETLTLPDGRTLRTPVYFIYTKNASPDAKAGEEGSTPALGDQGK
jgi:hypothetical protein